VRPAEIFYTYSLLQITMNSDHQPLECEWKIRQPIRWKWKNFKNEKSCEGSSFLDML